MRVTVTIPDELFKRAERLARKLGVSRSELYTHALREYLAQEERMKVGRVLRKAYAEGWPGVDPAVTAATIMLLRKEDRERRPE
jgi:hypothetical protein